MKRSLASLYEEFLRKAPRQARSRDVVEAILAAALERLSGAEEEEDVTVNDVARRAGVGIGSLYDYFRDRHSLLAAVAAKVTEDNLRGFEKMLEENRALSAEELLGKVVDYALDTYTKSHVIPRRVLKVAYAVGLVPALAESQTRFSKSLAAALRGRSDIDVPDDQLEHATYVATHALMGVIHTRIWEEPAAMTREELRAEMVRFFLPGFTRRSASPAAPATS